MVRYRRGLLAVLVLTIFLCGGCGADIQKYLKPAPESNTHLIKVQIVFSDTEGLVGYVKNLGIDKDSQLYTGGSSLNYLYDAQGNVTGSFNYLKVSYIKILP